MFLQAYVFYGISTSKSTVFVATATMFAMIDFTCCYFASRNSGAILTCRIHDLPTVPTPTSSKFGHWCGVDHQPENGMGTRSADV